MMKKKSISLLFFCWIGFCCNAQTAGFAYYAALDTVKTSGFYNIELRPELTAHLKTDYSDLRIVNDSGKWVPHLLNKWIDPKEQMMMYAVNILKKETSGGFTDLVVEKDRNILQVDGFDILVRNTSASRTAKISGSDDLNNWFVIKDSIDLTPVLLTKENIANCPVRFPYSNYKFFRILINNKSYDPFNILSVQRYSYIIMEPGRKPADNPYCSLLQKDSGKISYIKITQDQPYHFEYFRYKTSSAKYFYRKAELYIPYSETHSFSNPGNLYQSFYMASNITNEVEVPVTNAKTFYLLIYNEDNPALKIDTVITSLDHRYIRAYFDQVGNYKLIMDNPLAVMPAYDLAKLHTKIPASPSYLSFGKITAFEKLPIVLLQKRNNQWMIWLAIAAALIILLFFTRQMLKEVDKRKQHDNI